ncbi:MAG: DUF4384 domain-containing protein [Acidobacteriota bacterium]
MRLASPTAFPHPHTFGLTLVLAVVALFVPMTSMADGFPATKEIRVERIQVVPEINVDLWTSKGPNARYCVGETIEISFRTNADAYVAIFDTDTRGKTHRIFPNRYDREHFVRGGVTYDLPARGYRFRIEGPPGRETLHVVAAESREALRRAVDELIYHRTRPAAYGHSPYEAHRKIAVVADDVAYDTISHRVRAGWSCRARPAYRPWRR